MRYHPESLNKSRSLLKSSGLSKIKSDITYIVNKVEAKNNLSGIPISYIGNFNILALASEDNKIWIYGTGVGGLWFRTSNVVEVSTDGSSILVSTENSVYKLTPL